MYNYDAEKILLALLQFTNDQLREYLEQDEPNEGDIRLLKKVMEVEE